MSMFASHARALVVLLALVALASGCSGPSTAAGPGPWREGVVTSVPPELARINDLLADLAERLQPGLVYVRVQRATPPRDEPAREEPGEPRRSTGSGFVIDSSGLIVTNAHVVESAGQIQVRLADGRRFPATVVGRDGRVDLALLKIEGASRLTVLPLGDSNKLRVGELVLALGNPFGLEQSVSFGIVSRKGAPLTVAAPGFDFIQTDAAINPGNSGGPLVNLSGEVVGVNSMAAVNGSIGFAIPSTLVKMLLPQLASKGRVDWGWLGVAIAEVTEDDLGRLKLREPKGVLVRSVMPGEPADKGGVRADDVILGIDGTRLESPRDLQRVVSSTPVGKKVRVVLLREGQETELEVTIGLYQEREAPPGEAPRRGPRPAEPPRETPPNEAPK
ncbi:MAG: peptidase S1 [Candidatus Rokuibacteriota bacterium]|nr:MAG: peptidase S1 [Candidatus Rokubacteria bacterium]